jgi:hypothetical protein
LLIPPYPYVLTALADPEYRVQLVTAALTLVLVVGVLFAPPSLKDLLQTGLALAGAGLGAWALATVRPAASEVLGASWPLGLGWFSLLAGLLALALAGLAQLFGARE